MAAWTDDGGAGVADNVAFEKQHKKQPKKKNEGAVADADAAEGRRRRGRRRKTQGKRKYKSLRERKSEAQSCESRAGRGGRVHRRGSGPRDEPRPTRRHGGTRTLAADDHAKRKSGGKGAKAVPVAESGHKIAGSKGAGNRQAQIFATSWLAERPRGAAAGGRAAPVGGLRRRGGRGVANAGCLGIPEDERSADEQRAPVARTDRLPSVLLGGRGGRAEERRARRGTSPRGLEM